MGTNVQIKKDYISLNNIISTWYKKLCKQGGLCVAISRKAPRLLEWCADKFEHGSQMEVITEIALAKDFRKDVEAGISTNTQDHINRFIKLITLIPNEENVIENMSDSHWKTVFCDLYNKYMSKISAVRELLHRLNRILYLNCYWGLKTTGKMTGYVVEFIHNNE